MGGEGAEDGLDGLVEDLRGGEGGRTSRGWIVGLRGGRVG